jgi:transcription-repair coupling factor (superfamily II helicase)
MSIAEKILEKVQEAPSSVRAIESLRNEGQVAIKGAAGSLKSFFLANLFKSFSTQVVYVGVDLEEVEAVKEEIEAILDPSRVLFFPAQTKHRYSLHVSNTYAHSARLSTLETLADEESGVVVLNAQALLYKLPERVRYLREKISLVEGEEYEFDVLVSKLVDFGFTRELRVERSGDMSVRGGLVDAFPFSSEKPCRIEFWGNQIESIRYFDPTNQRSLRRVDRLDLYPHDFIYPDETASGSAASSAASLLDFLKSDAILVLEEPELIRKNIEESLCTDSEEPPQDSGGDSFWDRLSRRFQKHPCVNLISIGDSYDNLIDFGAQNQESLNGNFKILRESIEKLNRDAQRVGRDCPKILFLCDNAGHTTQIEDIFDGEGLTFPNLHFATLRLHQGFVFHDAGLVVYIDNQFYGRTRRLKLPQKSRQGLSPKQLQYLNVGDYVVHVDFGVGVFRGLKKVDVRGSERECLHLEYKEGDNLYVRLERMDRVHKYSSKDGMQPKLDKLGGADWQRLKARTKKKIKDIAQELIDLYAKRKAQSGVAFSEDSLWQRELEASFPYEDTPDQLKATLEVKADMESSRPMDRLVCGDVGFGKTEVAIRAAFKAVLCGKQVAMLVPTTILAYQHYRTFTDRLDKFPVQVEMLSRFKTRAEQKDILEQAKSGQSDIVIGTHRILSKDVGFKDLGLLIIDEEQRFGVRHKERLKKLRATVDVLTLTATPIPRTLYLSLMGARDITNITTPPKNRLPIQTEIVPFNKNFVREAILRELDRGGQTFFVHNRVRTIDRVATMLSGLVPEAKVAVGHGQLDEKELEKVMMEFMANKYQILVSTMIIENGLDMPNVNTIIVNRADKLGLAQLYQLRGRVGRSSKRAYAHLLIPPIETLTEDALKRLRAIEEFSDIGSGSHLAMRDLEIRGAGNLLGAEQSGYIDALGFDVYNKIVNEAVKELKAEKNLEAEPQVEIDTQVDMSSDVYLPENYIEFGAERVDVYRRLTDCGDLEQLDEIGKELRDRFGPLPAPVDNLIGFFVFRILGKQLRMSKIKVNEVEMIVEFDDELETQGEPFKTWLGSMVVNASSPFEFIQNHGLGIRVPRPAGEEPKLVFFKNFLQSLTASEISEPAMCNKSNINK